MMEKIFFDSWESIGRTLIVGTFAYIGLVLILRISGSRTLSQLNAFDFIVTVALGSTLATVLLNKDIPLLDGLVAFGLLIILQYLLSYAGRRSKKVQSVIKNQPFLLLYQGKLIEESLNAHRVAKDEILHVLRSNGISSLSEADAVVLETNGKFSVIKKMKPGGESTLSNIRSGVAATAN